MTVVLVVQSSVVLRFHPQLNIDCDRPRARVLKRARTGPLGREGHQQGHDLAQGNDTQSLVRS
jgi:hypothetical protein